MNIIIQSIEFFKSFLSGLFNFTKKYPFITGLIIGVVIIFFAYTLSRHQIACRVQRVDESLQNTLLTGIGIGIGGVLIYLFVHNANHSPLLLVFSGFALAGLISSGLWIFFSVLPKEENNSCNYINCYCETVRLVPINDPLELLPTHTPTSTPTHTPTPTNSPTSTPTYTPTPTLTNSPTNTPTHTPTLTPTYTPTNTPTMCPNFTIDIEDEEDNWQISINKELTLTATANVQGITFEWEEPTIGELTPDNDSATYKSSVTGSVQITVYGTDSCGQTNSKIIDLEIIQIQVNTPISPPVITSLEILPGGGLTVCWDWNGTLGPSNNFAVRFWSVNATQPEARFSLVWQREKCYQFQVNNAQFPQGNYYINVAVMDGPSSEEHTVVVESPWRIINVPDISGTEPPPP